MVSKARVFFKFGSPIFTKIILQLQYDTFLFITERFSFQIFLADEIKDGQDQQADLLYLIQSKYYSQ